jgi:small subunit ribosomal protein S1
LTEQQMGGTAPEPEDRTSVTDQASEQAVGAIAVADEPATSSETTDTSSETTDSSSETTDTSQTADESRGTETPSGADGAEPAATADPAAAVDAAATADPAAAGAANGVVPTGMPEAAAGATDMAAEVAAAAEPEGDAEPLAVADSSDGLAPAPSSQAAEPPPTPVVARAEPTGPEPATMEELLAEQDSDIKSFKHGDVVEGHVVRIDKDEILVDIGAKSEGVVSNRELYGRHGEQQPQLNVGDTVLVYVLQPESQEGHVVLSLRRAGLERKWRAMQEQFEAGVIIEAPVIDHNKGGLIVDCGIRGFVPISQIVDFPRRPQNDQPRDAAQEIAEKLQPFVGRKLRLKILEVNRKANRLILSEKVALYEERREKRDELFSSLQVGQKVTGTVRSIAPFGVFIDLGGIDGLVHKSELSWNKVNNPESGYKVGEEVEAEVIDINHERGRISLSIRRLQPDPWHSTVADYRVGDVIDGTVTKLVNFGAFVRVRDGLEGLIHISELSHQRVAHPGDVVHEGQQLKLKIISLDSERHRLGLSLKQAEEAPARPAPPEPAARTERRPRQERERERGYSLSDAVQEPEGGIDNTLAAAFAQVREQVAASEEASARDETDDAAPSATAETTAEAAPSATAEATAEAESAAARAETTETEAPAATAEPTAEADAESAAATAETEAPAATTETEDPAATEADAESATAVAEPTAEADAESATATAEPTAEAPEASAETEQVAKGEATSEEPAATAETSEAQAEPAKAAAPAEAPARAKSAKGKASEATSDSASAAEASAAGSPATEAAAPETEESSVETASEA